MLPEPEALHVPPPAPAHVQEQVSDAGKVSATVALVFEGPAFDAVMVYVVLLPGVAVVTPSVLVMLRSAKAVSVSVSVALLLPEAGSVALPVTVAVLEREPEAPAEIEHEAV